MRCFHCVPNTMPESKLEREGERESFRGKSEREKGEAGERGREGKVATC